MPQPESHILSVSSVFFIRLQPWSAVVLIIFLPLIPFLQVVQEGPSPLDPPNNTNIALSLQRPITFRKWFYKNGTTKYLLSCQPFLSHRSDETHQALKHRGSILDGGVGRYLHIHGLGKSKCNYSHTGRGNVKMSYSFSHGSNFSCDTRLPLQKVIHNWSFVYKVSSFFLLFWRREDRKKINQSCVHIGFSHLNSLWSNLPRKSFSAHSALKQDINTEWWIADNRHPLAS